MSETGVPAKVMLVSQRVAAHASEGEDASAVMWVVRVRLEQHGEGGGQGVCGWAAPLTLSCHSLGGRGGDGGRGCGGGRNRRHSRGCTCLQVVAMVGQRAVPHQQWCDGG